MLNRPPPLPRPLPRPRPAQHRVTRAFDRLARVYDALISPLELAGVRASRRRLLAHARGLTLEVGVGTGKNLGLYGPAVELVGVDLSERMLVRARRRAGRLGLPVRLETGDIHALAFDDASFDTVVATCVFCSVPDPLAGLRELRRVVKRHGQVLLLEHVRPDGRLGCWLADTFAGVTRAVLGDEWNRRTEDAVRAAGLEPVAVRRRSIWREIVARPA